MAGVALVLWTLASAVRTIVLPRASAVVLTRVHFRTLRRLFDVIAPDTQPFERRDRILAAYAPAALVLLPATWVVLILSGFTAVFWGAGIDPLPEAFAVSGSSLFTLEFDRPQGTMRVALSFVEAGLGLGLV